ncbi:MAG: NifB/NifX family molybdenum-iron cluster-binding protein [Eubacterium sp.]|nr:NifB/NifX family molybdenum-iron cluster-binding protein [Eubacterium sp.]
MKVAIPLDENKVDVCPVLARTPYFMFWEDGQESILENPAAKAQGGAGVQAAQFLVDNTITDLITPRCGQNAADVFKAAEITIYKSEDASAADNIKSWQEKKLEKLTQFHAGFHGIS